MKKIFDWLFRKSIRRQLIIGVAVVHLVLMTIFVYDLSVRQKEFLLEKSNSEAYFELSVLAEGIREYLRTEDFIGLQEIIETFSEDKSVNYVMIIAEDGRILSHSDKTKRGLYLTDPKSVSFLTWNTEIQTIISDEQTIDLALPIFEKNTFLGWARVSRDLSEDQYHIDYVTRQGLTYTILAILVGTLFAFILSRVILRQLKLLLDGTARLAKHKLDEPIAIVAENEIGAVSKALNDAMKEIELKDTVIRKSEEWHRTIINTAMDGFFVADLKGRLLAINETYCRMSGYSRDELQKMKISDLEVVEYDSEIIEHINALKEIGEHRFESKHKRKDGSIFDIEVSTQFKNVDNGRIVVFIKDITEQKKAARELSKSRSYNRFIINNTPIGLALRKLDGKIIDINPAFATIIGRTVEEALQLTTWDLTPGKYLDEETHQLKLMEKTGSYINYEKEYIHKDGHLVPIRLNGLTIELGDEKLILSTVEDITEKKKILDELVRAKDKAESSDRLKSEFLAQISHEIRSPLNVIINLNSLLHSDFSLFEEKEREEIFNSISSSSQRIIRTIDLILNSSEMQIGSYTPVFKEIDIYNDILIKAYKELKRNSELKSLKLTINKLTEDTTENCDEYSIFQTFVNLIDNAIKYTETGNIDVTIIRNENKHLQVEIADTGIGMTDEFMEHIFEPFTQEQTGYTRRFEGTGLGLSLVKNYCALNHVQINVKSKVKVGTVFILKFNSNNYNK